MSGRKLSNPTTYISSWFVPACLSSTTGTVGQLHKFTWKLAIRQSNVGNPLNQQAHRGGWEHGTHSFLNSTLDGPGKGQSSVVTTSLSLQPRWMAPVTNELWVPAGPACSLFTIPTELFRLHTLRFVYSRIMNEWWGGSDFGTMRSWPKRGTTICLAARYQPGTPYYV